LDKIATSYGAKNDNLGPDRLVDLDYIDAIVAATLAPLFAVATVDGFSARIEKQFNARHSMISNE
jgi:hypothetical protein